MALIALKVFLQMNGLFAVSYLTFRACRGFAARPRGTLNWARALIIVSLAGPVLLRAVPSERLPRLPLHAMGVEIDSGEIGGRRFGRAKNRHAPAFPEATVPDSRVGWLESLLNSLTNISFQALGLGALGAYAVAVALKARRTRGRFRALSALLARTTVVRSVGRVRIAVSDEIVIPFSTLLSSRAWVVLPAEILSRQNDFKIAVSHELQHHRQSDTAWTWFDELTACFMFLNPALPLWRREITELQEFSCDEALIGRKRFSTHDYGCCLLRVAEAALGARSMYVGTTYMAACPKDPAYFKSFLRRRVEMLVRTKTSKGRSRAGALLGTLVVSLTMSLAYASQQVFAEPEGVNPGAAVFDKDIQAIAEGALKGVVRKYRAQSALAVVSDPNTGRILAVANIDGEGNPTKHAKNWGLSEPVELASIGKTIIVAAALENGATTLDENLSCENGSYKVGDHVYHDWRKFDHLTTAETVTMSSNICGIKVAEKLGAKKLGQTFADFGFGAGGTAQEYPQARVGHIPGQKEMGKDDYVPILATGYNFEVTPIEVLQAYGAIANGGNLIKPQLATAPESSGTIIRRVLSLETSRKMRAVLADVMVNGTGKKTTSSLYTLAGKTSTSDSPANPEHERLGGKANVAGFVGFAPSLNPKVAVYVVVKLPDHEAAHGAEHAAPVFAQIAEGALKHMKVPADK